MNKVIIPILMAGLFIVASGFGTARAAVYTFGDTANYWPGYSDSLGDVFGTPDILGGSVDTTAKSLSVNLSVPKYWSTFNKLTLGDVFISVDGDSNWEFVLAPSSHSKSSGWIEDPGVWNVYAVDLALGDAANYEFSYKPASNTQIREGHPYRAADSVLDSAPVLGLVAFSGLSAASYNGQLLSMSWTWLLPPAPQGDINLPENLIVGMTVSCANDVLYEHIAATPIPGAVWLFGSGLFGLVGMRFRKRVNG